MDALARKIDAIVAEQIGSHAWIFVSSDLFCAERVPNLMQHPQTNLPFDVRLSDVVPAPVDDKIIEVREEIGRRQPTARTGAIDVRKLV